jgi:NADH dehydrogenase FAD-containing subunit
VPELSESARKQLQRIGVEVRLDMKVENIDDKGVTITGGERNRGAHGGVGGGQCRVADWGESRRTARPAGGA